MKKLFVVTLTLLLLVFITSCSQDNNMSSQTNEEGTSSFVIPAADEKPYSFISVSEKQKWKEILIKTLAPVEVHNINKGTFGSFGIGLFDINLDNTPEVVAAYAGGSMGNVFLEFYDLESGRVIYYLNAAHYESWDNVFFCVAEKDKKFIIFNMGSMEFGDGDIGFSKLVFVHNEPASFDPEKNNSELMFLEKLPPGEKYYEYNGKAVSEEEYHAEYERFFTEYKVIKSTQMKIIKWEKFEEFKNGTKEELVEKMAEALINNPQNFVNVKTDAPK